MFWGLVAFVGLCVLIGIAALFIKDKSTQQVFIQLLCVDAPFLQRAIRDIAVSGDADQPGELERMFLKAVEATLNSRSHWVYGRADLTFGSFMEMAMDLENRAVLARAAFTSETTKNQQDGVLTGPTFSPSTARPDEGAALYFALTLGAVLDTTRLQLKATPNKMPIRAEHIEELLRALLHTEGRGLLRVQVVWSPDVAGEFLTEEQAIRKYPDLGKL